MLNFKLDISYNGKNYSGWQKQKDRITIQQTIEDALKKIFKIDKIVLIGASRTDAGAHAYHQIANFKLPEKFNLSPEVLLKQLNNLLPDDIRINSVKKVSENFHSRFDAIKREYRYYIYNDTVLSPFFKDFTYFYPYKIDFGLLKKTVRFLKGEHNFIYFANISKSNIKNTMRRIYKFCFYKKKNIITFVIIGNGFLKGMIRNMIGTILKINRLNQNPKLIKELLELKKPCEGNTVPSSGLFLYKVYFKLPPGCL